jgi:MFS family permease
MSGFSAAVNLLLFTERGRFSLLSFLMLTQCYAIRIVMSVGIIPIAKEFSYSSVVQGYVLSSFFFGYMMLQIPAGTLGAWYGGKRIFTLGILLPSLLTALTPLVASNPTALVTLRVFTGLSEGVSYPALHALMGKWVPAGERSILLNVMWSGAFLGSALTLPIAGALCSTSMGWRGAFYFYALLGVAISGAFWLLTSDSPETHPRISAQEAEYIVSHRTEHEEGSSSSSSSSSSTGSEVDAPLLPIELEAKPAAPAAPAASAATSSLASTPFLRIFLCPSALSCFFAHAAHNFSYYLLISELPSYMKSQLGLSLEAVTSLAAIPYLACFVGANIGGSLGDWAIARGYRVAHVRKAAFALGELLPALALIACGFTSSVTVVILLLTVAVGFSGLSQTGFACTSLDIAPHLGGVLMGIQNTLATVPGIIAPILTGYITTVNDRSHWQLVFYITGIVAVAGVAVYLTFATDELVHSLQPGYKGPWVCTSRARKGGSREDGVGEEEEE